MKIISFLSKKKSQFLEAKFSIYLNRRVFVMKTLKGCKSTLKGMGAISFFLE